jgi:hypothetical protein
MPGTRLLALLLVAIQAALLLRTAWDKSDTVDEPHYLAHAVLQWREADFDSNCDSPALPKWGYALVLRLGDPILFSERQDVGRHPLWSKNERGARRNLFLARLVTILVTLAGGLFLRAAASRYGARAASLSHALWCFSPTLLAHGSLATMDAWVTSAMCLVAWMGLRFVESPGPGRALAVGAAFALAAASKFTALAAVPVLIGLGAAVLRRSGWGVVLRTGLAACLAFALTLWTVYGFGVGALDTARPCGVFESRLPDLALGPLPAAPWLSGLLAQLGHGSGGHLGYLFGEVRFTGWWWFYLAALALKTTLGAQALAALALWRRLSLGRALPWGVDLALLAFPAILIVGMSLGKTQNGVKYVMPAFPFLMLWGARVLASLEPGSWLWRGAVAALMAGAVESLAVHPHHLMFFNLWAGGPEGGPRYLVHGDDWGQDQRRLGEWQAQTRPWRLFYTYYNGSPKHWGISYEPPPCSPTPGYYALHAVEVHRPKRIGAGCLDWLTVEPPDARLGYSIYLYLVTRDRIQRLERNRDSPAAFWRSAPRPSSGT